MSAALLSRLLTREECAELSQLLEAKYIQTLGTVGTPPLAKTAAGQSPKAPALLPDDPCDACESERVVLNWDDCIVRPCPVCRPAEALAFAADRGEAAELADTIPPPADADPITLTSAEMVAAERAYERNMGPRYAGPSFTSDDPHRFDEDPGDAKQQKADAERARRVVEMLRGGK